MSEPRLEYRYRMLAPEEFNARLARVTLVAFDVDGTLTDGRIGFVGAGADRCLFFHTHDGHGIRNLREAGVSIAWVTANRFLGVAERAKSLRVLYLIQGRQDKKAAIEELGIPWEQIAYVGDDENDVPSMLAASVAFSPANATPPAAVASHVRLQLSGGNGAAREACDLILRAKGFAPFVAPDGVVWRKP
jgi:3-deoxy-D-manno-octulosonate 8-phosphate phosphatase (KDO 8-P phosphatase)